MNDRWKNLNPTSPIDACVLNNPPLDRPEFLVFPGSVVAATRRTRDFFQKHPDADHTSLKFQWDLIKHLFSLK
jgi:hypothetical protein